ncbi:winged helix-turn-helix domain-containing protein [Thalassotalea atypica]|uniref:winged helix-turn-helix domain-containing protein n=1 Tax=Thalassotalea atypica TaxID=2054316 RepID=UPI002572CC15|nr:winged helix-turn-helix domain-containing protein [Thalassotalea atypica]
MAEQYWVGEFFIDLTRNQITQKMQSRTIPPKALAVLTCLAKNANKVVSQDELLSEVWPDTVVTPNTLQRSVAQLRKALGENSQSYIKTHAKQGYSLECEVRWQDSVDAESLLEQEPLSKTTPIGTNPITPEHSIEHRTSIVQPENTVTADRSKLKSGFIALMVGVIILGFIGVNYFSATAPYTLSFGELRSLTATDNKEFGGIYSPDGEYIVFLRYSERLCIESNVWAKNIKTQQESQLTQNMGRYGTPSFSPDGKHLIFVETENCARPITQKNCYKLMNLDFAQALKSAQSPSTLLECKNSTINKPTWLNSNNIALLQKTTNRWKLVNYSLKDNISQVIYSINDGNIIDYDYSVTDDLIAIISTHNDGQNHIEILKPDGQILSSYPIDYPEEVNNQRNIYPNFIPNSEQLIFSTGRQLFTLSFQGKITNTSLPLDESIGSPVFHPNGKQMLMIKGHWDSDIATIPLSQIPKVPLSQFQESNTFALRHDTVPDISILERSTLGEDDAIYQPDGDLIAFISGRSGEDQIWITDGNRSTQLTNFPIDTDISGLDWSTNGKSLLVNANNLLTQVDLDSNQKHFPIKHAVVRLYQWDSENNSALLLVRIQGILKLVELNLASAEYTVITDKTVNWALKTDEGRLIYTDQMDRFWQPGPAEDQLIGTLEGQGSAKQRFIIKDNIIYGVNDDFELWSYTLSDGAFEVIGQLPDNVDAITDINQTNLLMSVRITAKKEVAELYLNE